MMTPPVWKLGFHHLRHSMEHPKWSFDFEPSTLANEPSRHPEAMLESLEKTYQWSMMTLPVWKLGFHQLRLSMEHPKWPVSVLGRRVNMFGSF